MTRLPFENVLPATKSQTHRGYRFTPATATDAHEGTLTYQTKGERSVYTVTEFPADLSGRAFRCEKVGGESYDVLIGDGNQSDICDCRGFERFGACKHVDCLRDLIAEGQLPHPQANPDADAGETEYEDMYGNVIETAGDLSERIARQRAELATITRYDGTARRVMDEDAYFAWLRNPTPLAIAPPDQDMW